MHSCRGFFLLRNAMLSNVQARRSPWCSHNKRCFQEKMSSHTINKQHKRSPIKFTWFLEYLKASPLPPAPSAIGRLLNSWTVGLVGLAGLAGLDSLILDYQENAIRNLSDTFSYFGGWFCSLGTRFWHLGSTFWGSRRPQGQQREHLRSQVWILIDFWWIFGTHFGTVLEHLTHFAIVWDDQIQHRFSGGFLFRFGVEMLLKSDGQMCWNHCKYNGFR